MSGKSTGRNPLPGAAPHVARAIQLRPSLPGRPAPAGHLAPALGISAPPATCKTGAAPPHLAAAIQRQAAPAGRTPAPHVARAMGRPALPLQLSARSPLPVVQRKPSDLDQEFGGLGAFNLSPLKALQQSAWQSYVVNVKPYFKVSDDDTQRQAAVLPTAYSRALSLSAYFAHEFTPAQRQLAARVNAGLAAEVTSLGNDISPSNPVYDSADGSFAEIEIEAGYISIENGFIRQANGRVRNFRAKLDFKKVKVSQAAVLAQGQANTEVDALEIKTLAAKWNDGTNQDARGTRAGSLICYHLALLAAQKGILYIVAGDVTGARDGFYTPHGFQDYLNAPSFAQLNQQITAQQTQIRAYSQLSPEEFAKVREDNSARMGILQGLREGLAANRIFVTTALLRQRSLNALQARWTQRL